MEGRREQDEASYQDEQARFVTSVTKHNLVLGPRNGDHGAESAEFVSADFEWALGFLVEDLLTEIPLVGCVSRFERGFGHGINSLAAVHIEKKLMILALGFGWKVYEVGKNYIFTARHGNGENGSPVSEHIIYRGNFNGLLKVLGERLLSHLSDLPKRADARAKFELGFFRDIERIREAMRNRLGF